MKVYEVVYKKKEWDYEKVFGIFSTKEKAEKAIRDYADYSTSIVEYELDNSYSK